MTATNFTATISQTQSSMYYFDFNRNLTKTPLILFAFIACNLKIIFLIEAFTKCH